MLCQRQLDDHAVALRTRGRYGKIIPSETPLQSKQITIGVSFIPLGTSTTHCHDLYAAHRPQRVSALNFRTMAARRPSGSAASAAGGAVSTTASGSMKAFKVVKVLGKGSYGTVMQCKRKSDGET